jgi:hypothetical protein
MPIAYLDAPQGIEGDEKRKLVKAMYDALACGLAKKVATRATSSGAPMWPTGIGK